MTVPWGRWLGLGLAATYLVFGVVALCTNQGGLDSWPLWSGIALVSGAALLTAGVIGRWRSATLELSLVICGLVLGIMATLWTVVLPMVAVLVAAILLRELVGGEHAREHRNG